MLAIKFATHNGKIAKTFLERTFVYCWIAKPFPPIVMFTVVQNRSGKFFFPCIPWCLCLPLEKRWFGFGHWLK
jgi:hypothetical protein